VRETGIRGVVLAHDLVQWANIADLDLVHLQEGKKVKVLSNQLLAS
jgi:hypothetical protein